MTGSSPVRAVFQWHQEQVGAKEVAEVVDSQVGFEVTSCLGVWIHHHFCIVDQNRELLFLCQKALCKGSVAFGIGWVQCLN